METSPQWLEIVLTGLAALVTAFLVPFLKRKGAAAKAEREAHEANAAESTISARGKLVSRLQEFLYGSAAAIAEKRFPALAANILKKRMTKVEVKLELRKWGQVLKENSYVYFGHQGIDLAKAVGDEFVDKLIERVANKVSPFPGRETAKELLKSNVSDWLIDKGVDWVKAKYLQENGLHPNRK